MHILAKVWYHFKGKIVSLKWHKNWAEIWSSCPDAGIEKEISNFCRKGNRVTGGVYWSTVSKERARLWRTEARTLKTIKSVGSVWHRIHLGENGSNQCEYVGTSYVAPSVHGCWQKKELLSTCRKDELQRSSCESLKSFFAGTYIFGVILTLICTYWFSWLIGFQSMFNATIGSNIRQVMLSDIELQYLQCFWGR